MSTPQADQHENSHQIMQLAQPEIPNVHQKYLLDSSVEASSKTKTVGHTKPTAVSTHSQKR
jgi:hypothetical protein